MSDQNDDQALIRLALAISNKPVASHDQGTVRVTDPFSGEQRPLSLRDQDLTQGRFQQLEDRPRQRAKQPFEDQFMRAQTPEERVRTTEMNAADQDARQPIAQALDQFHVPQLVGGESYADHAQRVAQSPLGTPNASTLPGLDMSMLARQSRAGELSFLPPMRNGEPQWPATWYHGTTHDIHEVNMAKANPESYYGEGFYATSNPHDAGTNYASTHSPDLRRKLEARTDEIENELVDSKYGGEQPAWNAPERKDLIDEARRQARAELMGPHAGMTMPLRLKMQKPIILTHDQRATWFDFTPDVDEQGEVIAENPLAEKFRDAVLQAAREYDFDANHLLENPTLADMLYTETRASDLDAALWGAMRNAEPTHAKTGILATGATIRDIYRHLGYDSIIMDAHKTFNGMQDVTPGTLHAIVFEPHQVRSVNAAFDPAKATSANILHADPFGAGAALRLSASHPQMASTAAGAATGAAIGSDVDEDHPFRGAAIGAVAGALAGNRLMARGAQTFDDRGAILRKGQQWVPVKKKDFKFTDLPRSARYTQVYNEILQREGYTVNPHTGNIVAAGQPGPTMAGKYPNGSKRTGIFDRSTFKPDTVRQWFLDNYDVFAGNKKAHIGGWIAGDKVYLDIAVGHDSVRQAVKTAEHQRHPIGSRTDANQFLPRGQEAVWDPMTGEHPVGNVHEFINSPEFKERMDAMATTGHAAMEGGNWWNIRGGPIEETYGSENMPIVAGMLAATSPQQGVEANIRMATEYVRRVLKGEPAVQPHWRMPKGSVGFEKGLGMPMEQTHKNNVARVADWNMEKLQEDKVNDMYHALMGDVNASVYDRHWAKIAEDPARGIYADRMVNKISGSMMKGKRTPYADLENVVRDAAKEHGSTVADYSAWVWEGIRKTIKDTDRLFGQIHEGDKIPGRPESISTTFERLLKEKADLRNVPIEEFKRRLRTGDATLLSALLATQAGMLALREWKAQAGDQTPPGGRRAPSGPPTPARR